MTRQARTLLVLGVFGVAAVVALGAMARRYGAILEARTADHASRPASTSTDAERRVRAFVAIEERLADERTRSGSRPAEERRQRLERVREHELAAQGLAREEYDRIAAMVRVWIEDGTAPPEPYRQHLTRLREYLVELESGPR